MIWFINTEKMGESNTMDNVNAKNDNLTDINNNLFELNLSVDLKTKRYTDNNNEIIDEKDVVQLIINHRYRMEYRTISRDNIKGTLSLILSNHDRDIMIKCKDSIKYDPNIRSNIDEYVNIIIGDNVSSIEKQMSIVTIQNELYTVKRRLYGYTASTPLFINYYGDENAGKNVSIRKRYSVLPSHKIKEISDGSSQFNDNRFIKSFEDNVCIVLPELGGMAKADRDKIKCIIDSPHLGDREFHTQNMRNITNNAQLLGTSNERLRDTLTGDTNVRKFAEIDYISYPSEKERIEKQWNKINNFDYLSLWRAIDENNEQSPVDRNRDEFIKWTSRKIVNQSPSNKWFTEFLIKNEGKHILWSEINEDYKQYMHSHFVNDKFWKGENKLRHLIIAGGCVQSKNRNDGRKYVVPLKETSKLYLKDSDENIID